MWAVFSQTFSEFLDDECPRLAAATAYHTFFALPALLVLIVMTAGIVLVNHDKDIKARLRSHFEETIGPEGSEEISKIVENARKLSHPSESGPGWAIGIGMLLLGATGALQELQTALNRAWHVEPDPQQGGFRYFLLKRLISLALLLGITVLVFGSLAIILGVAVFRPLIVG